MPAHLAHILNPVDSSPQVTGRFVKADVQDPVIKTIPFPSYKRVPKACTQCRRDKSRCDRVRPCWACVRKGRSDTCIDGCVPCRQAKLSCDETRPCSSCVQFGCTCVDDDPSVFDSRKRQKESADLSLAPRKIRPQPHIDIPASDHLGLDCISCRRDDEKCTGGSPCRHCANLGERCMYGTRLPIFAKQRCAICRKKNKKCERIRPCVHCIKADTPCVDLPRKSSGVGFRVKRACAGCRADKIQCEDARPCGACKKKNIHCVEGACHICFMKDIKCANCTKEKYRLHLECEANATASHSEEENDNVSSLYSLSPTSPQSCNSLSTDHRRTGVPQSPSSLYDNSESRRTLTPAMELSKSLESSLMLPSFDIFDPYNEHCSLTLRALDSPLSQLQTIRSELPSSSNSFYAPSRGSTSHMGARPSCDISKH